MTLEEQWRELAGEPRMVALPQASRELAQEVFYAGVSAALAVIMTGEDDEPGHADIVRLGRELAAH